MLAGEFRLIIDFRPDYSDGLENILEHCVRWRNVGECCAIVMWGQTSEPLRILRLCGCEIMDFTDYPALSGIFSSGCIAVSNDVVFEQIISPKITVYSSAAGFFLKKDIEYKRKKYGCLPRDAMLKALAAFRFFPEFSEMHIISKARKYAANKGRLGVFWEREAGRRAVASIRLNNAEEKSLPMFDSGRFVILNPFKKTNKSICKI